MTSGGNSTNQSPRPVTTTQLPSGHEGRRTRTYTPVEPQPGEEPLPRGNIIPHHEQVLTSS